MASAKPVKGILKKTTSPPGGRDDAADTDTDPTANGATHSRRLRSEQDAAEIARKHAAILQQRKDLEATIFANIEALTDLPRNRSPAFSAAAPDPADAAVFKRLVRIFQPSDYDDLIEERNVYGHCGYCLCPNPRKTYAGGGAWKLVHHGSGGGGGGGGGGGIVAKAELEKWCSAACARRALYIKVQLNETAAWERVGIPDIVVDLLPEEGRQKEPKESKEQKDTAVGRDASHQDKDRDHLAQDLARLRLGEERRLAQNAQTLALERGEAPAARDAAPEEGQIEGDGAFVPTAPRVDVSIIEKKVVVAPTAPTLDGPGTRYGGDEDDEDDDDGGVDAKADDVGNSPAGDGNKAGDSTSGGEDKHMMVEGHRIRFVAR